MEALVETHNAEEIETALTAGAQVIGLNNRDLDTLETSLEVTERLAALVPPERTLVSESGIHSAADVERLAAVGVEAILVGGQLMQSEDPGRALRELTGVASKPEAR
jgi:indole-3-glycerol phosphate synthase